MQRTIYDINTGAVQTVQVNAWTNGTEVIQLDDGDTAPMGYTQITDAQAETFLAGLPEPVPQEITRFQAKAALRAAGLLAQVQAAMNNPATDEFARLAWTEAPVFLRTSPTLLAMAAALGLSEAQLDDLFRAGKKIKA